VLSWIHWIGVDNYCRRADPKILLWVSNGGDPSLGTMHGKNRGCPLFRVEPLKKNNNPLFFYISTQAIGHYIFNTIYTIRNNSSCLGYEHFIRQDVTGNKRQISTDPFKKRITNILSNQKIPVNGVWHQGSGIVGAEGGSSGNNGVAIFQGAFGKLRTNL